MWCKLKNLQPQHCEGIGFVAVARVREELRTLLNPFNQWESWAKPFGHVMQQGA